MSSAKTQCNNKRVLVWIRSHFALIKGILGIEKAQL